MSRVVVSLFLLVALLLPTAVFGDVDKGDRPTYTATVLGGAELSSEQLRGKVVLVDFWATWCGPCKDSFPFYSELVDTHGGKLVVLAVSVDAKHEDVRAFLAGSDFAFTVVWNKEHPLAQTFGPSMFPTSYLIDKEGVVRHIHRGFDDEVGEKTAAQIEALVEQE